LQTKQDEKLKKLRKTVETVFLTLCLLMLFSLFLFFYKPFMPLQFLCKCAYVNPFFFGLFANLNAAPFPPLWCKHNIRFVHCMQHTEKTHKHMSLSLSLSLSHTHTNTHTFGDTLQKTGSSCCVSCFGLKRA